MQRKTAARQLVLAAGLGGLLTLSGCKPDIPLIPFIKSDRVPYGALHEAPPASATRPDRSPRATPAPSHTVPAAARPLP